MSRGARARTRLGAAAASLLLLAGAAARARADAAATATGLRRLIVADPAGAGEIGAAVWYPTAAPPVPTQLGPYRLDLAPDANPSPGVHPLVVISHGTGGSAYNHHDAATALVRAGFAVASLTHPGDNFRDRSAFGTSRQLFDRPRHVRAVLDAVLADPAIARAVDPARIGGLGFSAGGYTVLVLAGAVPDPEQLVQHFKEHPDDPVLRLGRPHQDGASARPPPDLHDARVKALVLLAPTLISAFDARGLAPVTVPVRLYAAERDEVLHRAFNADRLRALLPHAPEFSVVEGAGHYVFLPPCPERLRREVAVICIDPVGVNRAAVHARLNAEIVAFFRRTLR